MQSIHAGAGFMKVDPFGKKSHPKQLWDVILGIWAPFGEPVGALCALWAALGSASVPSAFSLRFWSNFSEKRTPLEAVCGLGPALVARR